MKKLILLLAVMATVFGAVAQERTIRMPEEKNLGPKYSDMQTLSHGFFFAAELGGGYSINKSDNFGYTELDAVGGYRFSEYLRAGIGLGARYYTNNPGCYRRAWSRWAMPLYVNLRGNFIPTGYRSVVPYWSLDAGAVFPDGFMFRPAVGLRIGMERSAFLLALTYTGGTIRTLDTNVVADKFVPAHKFRSFLGLRIGYEF